MKFTSLVLSLLLVGSFYVRAANDEMQTETTKGHASTLPADDAGKLRPSLKPPSPADFKLRAAVRKKAPFWIDDKTHGAAIRVNKDGTYSSEAGGGGSIAGTWKAMKNEIQFTTNDGGEKYSYPIKIGKGGAISIREVKATKGRYHLN